MNKYKNFLISILLMMVQSLYYAAEESKELIEYPKQSSTLNNNSIVPPHINFDTIFSDNEFFQEYDFSTVVYNDEVEKNILNAIYKNKSPRHAIKKNRSSDVITTDNTNQEEEEKEEETLCLRFKRPRTVNNDKFNNKKQK